MVKEFDLNIEKILENWEVYHAIREIIANALDEQMLTHTKDIEIYKDSDNEAWHIRDYGRGINYHHLTQNENVEKLNTDGLIGKFGVGLKDALATLYRNNIHVLVRSKYGIITLKQAAKEGFSDVVTLHAQIAPSDDDSMIGTDFVLGKCKDEDIEKAEKLFLCFSGETALENTGIGSILQKKDSDPANIYINGVKVATEDNFLFSYNITKLPQKLKRALNRERANVGRTAYSDSIKSMLKSVECEDVLELLMKDLEGIQKGTVHDEMGWIDVQMYAVEQLSKKNAKILFITSMDAINKRMEVSDAQDDGYRVFIIPDRLKDKAKNISSVTTVERYVKKKDENFSAVEVEMSSLTPLEKEVYDKLPEILAFMGGIPDVVAGIKISESLYSSGEGSGTLGLWDQKKYIIWIKRSQLRSVEEFAGTLIHECTHALSRQEDVSRAFESALTQNLGKQAAYYLKKGR